MDFGDLYMSAVLTPEEAEERAKDLAERVQERVTASMEGWKVLGRTSSLDPNAAQKIATSPTTVLDRANDSVLFTNA